MIDRPQLLMASLALTAAFSSLTGCGSEGEKFSAENKEACIVEVSSRLLACAEERECEKGVSRFAGYCYNTAPGDQLDICRGGYYFFEQPIAELAVDHTEIGQLNKRQNKILIQTGEHYCTFNYN